MTLSYRPLGRSGLAIAPLAFGGNVFGWTADEATSFALLDAFVASGCNLVDTADVYSRWAPGHRGGESERVLGRWLQARPGARARIVLATKVGFPMGDEGSGRGGLSRRWIRQAVDESLQRLQTDHIDLYQAHTDDTATPLEETLGAFAELVAEGKVRAIGASNCSAPRLAEALAVSRRLGLPRYECLQPRYNLVDRAGFEQDLQPLVLREQVGVINFYGLAAGFLTGKYRREEDLGQRARAPRVKDYLHPRGLAILAALDEVAAQLGSTPAAVALAWQMAQPGITAPIASATSVAQLQQLLAATQLTLDASTLAHLAAASAWAPAAG